jgi:hypothetical protein
VSKAARRIATSESVSQNRYSTALRPFVEVGVHLGVYDVCLGPTTCSG